MAKPLGIKPIGARTGLMWERDMVKGKGGNECKMGSWIQKPPIGGVNIPPIDTEHKLAGGVNAWGSGVPC